MSAVLISACLLGVCCRYDGKSKPCSRAAEAAGGGVLIPICPEQLGGLPTPRTAAYITEGDDGFSVLAGSGRVKTLDGDDVTEHFKAGARQAVKIAEITGAKRAILKSKSPSCGVSGCTGVAAAALILEGIDVEELG